MSRVNQLEAELSKANARIAELEKTATERPLTIRRMKAEIAQAIGVELSGPYPYCTTVSRNDLLKIHAWVMARSAI